MTLERETNQGATRPVLARNPAGFASLAIGVLALAISYFYGVADGGFPPPSPSPWLTAPFFALAVAAAGASWLRREGHWWLGAGGIALAAVAAVLGWAVIVALVLAVTIVAISVLQEVM